MEIALLKNIREKASKLNRTIVLPESHDERVLKAAEIITKENIAKVITLGNENKIKEDAKKLNVSLDNVEIIDFVNSAKFDVYAEEFYNLRKHKGMTIEKAKETLTRDIFYAAMMVRNNEVSGSVAGSTASTADVMKAGILCVGVPQGISVVSSFFLMLFPDKSYSFADCVVVPNPDSAQLADIAISTADNHKKLTGEEPCVAML
ncbi:MAG: phosphate acyltransferase, partial [Bacteroidota bacterium]|nr:phosphate acyltransferase [Bacteroidota bacterium]